MIGSESEYLPMIITNYISDLEKENCKPYYFKNEYNDDIKLPSICQILANFLNVDTENK